MNFFKSDLVKKVALITGIFLAFTLSRSIYRTLGATDKLEEERRRVETLLEENRELKEEVEKTEQDKHIEFLAREKLGLAREGETVVVLPDEDILRRLAPKLDQEAYEAPAPNWQRWTDMFLRN